MTIIRDVSDRIDSKYSLSGQQRKRQNCDEVSFLYMARDCAGLGESSPRSTQLKLFNLAAADDSAIPQSLAVRDDHDFDLIYGAWRNT